MILVSQGHEKGIGLEVLLKALILAPVQWLHQTTLFANRSTVAKHIETLRLPLAIDSDGIHFPQGLVRCVWIKGSTKLPQSTQCLQEALETTELVSSPVLFTLPTTKDDLRDPTKPTKRFLGHTEYLRAHFKTPELGMFFTADDLHVLLVSDHVRLSNLSKICLLYTSPSPRD